MKEKSISFNSEMVKAILEGRKSQTRRVNKLIPVGDHYGKDIMDWALSAVYKDKEGRNCLAVQTDVDDNSFEYMKCPYGEPGDRLWVRETWCHCGAYRYYATETDGVRKGCKWKPSTHMSRIDSRITLEITDVRVERLQDINNNCCMTDADTIKEGCPKEYIGSGEAEVSWFRNLWNSIAKPGVKWQDNPWVWIVEFKKI